MSGRARDAISGYFQFYKALSTCSFSFEHCLYENDEFIEFPYVCFACNFHRQRVHG